MIIQILLLCLVGIHCSVLPFNQQILPQVLGSSHKHILFLLTQDSETQALQQFRLLEQSIGQQSNEVLFLHSDLNDGYGLLHTLRSYLKLDNLPMKTVVFLLTADNNRYLYQSPKYDKDSLHHFYFSAVSDKLPQYFQSDPIPSSQPSLIKQLVGKNFQLHVLHSPYKYLVLFYTPNCPACDYLMPIFQEAAEQMQSDPNFVFARMNGASNELSFMTVTQYPSIAYWGPDKTAPFVAFNGDRSPQGIVHWLNVDMKNHELTGDMHNQIFDELTGDMHNQIFDELPGDLPEELMNNEVNDEL